jgi:Flp pilus assembly protein TadD
MVLINTLTHLVFSLQTTHLAPSPTARCAYRGHGQLLADSGRAAEAMAALPQAASLAPGDAHVHYAIGALLANTGDLAGAVRGMPLALQLIPAMRPHGRRWPS